MSPSNPPLGSHPHELVASFDAAAALRRHFEQQRPEFIAIHDVGTRSSRKLLAGIASAARVAEQALPIRRTGDGATLATLAFVDLPTAAGPALRVYSTEADGDAAAREPLARTLLAFSTLGVLFVGEAPAPSISGLFKPLHDQMIAGPWPNRHLLLLPLSTANPLVAHGMDLARGTGVDVRTTPQVARPADAWNFISSTWARLRGPVAVAPAATQPGPGPGVATRPGPGSWGATASGPVTAPVASRPMPPAPTQPPHGTAPAGAADVLDRYLAQVSRITGMVACCIFDVASGRHHRHAGGAPGAAELAEHGAELLATMLVTSRTLGLGHALPEAAITLGEHHLVLRGLPKHPGLALHAVLDKTQANLTLARLQLARMDAVFDEPT